MDAARVDAGAAEEGMSMKRSIVLKKEAIETMCEIAGRLALSEFKTVFDSGEDSENGEYEYYYLHGKSQGAGLHRIDEESDDYSAEVGWSNFYSELPKGVSFGTAQMQIERGIAYLNIMFDFTDFVNANIEECRYSKYNQSLLRSESSFKSE